MASLTPAASPSRTRPSTVMRSPRDFGVTSDSCPVRTSEGLKKGPTVCDGVCSGLISACSWSPVAATQYEGESIAQCVIGNSNFDVECCYQPFARGMVRDAVKDRIESHQRIARKIHLSNQSSGETRTEKAEVNVIRPPRIVMIAPRIRTRLDRCEAVGAVLVGHDSSDASEMGIERCFVLVLKVCIAAGGVRLPNFDRSARNRAAVFVKHAAGHNDSLAESLAAAEVRQIVFAVDLRQVLAFDAGSGDFRQRVIEPYRRMTRRSLVGARVSRLIVRRMNSHRLAPIADRRIHRASSFAISSNADFAIRNAEFATGTPA